MIMCRSVVVDVVLLSFTIHPQKNKTMFPFSQKNKTSPRSQLTYTSV